MRDKNEVKKLVNLDYKQLFVYSSGRYDSAYNKTTVAFPLTAGKNGNVIVYDLRYDPTPFTKMSVKELSKTVNASWEDRQVDDYVKLPVKELQYNRAPAVAPIGVLSQSDGWSKIQLTEAEITKNKDVLLTSPDFAENIRTVFELREEFKKSADPELQLYDGFVPDIDKMRIEKVRGLDQSGLADFHPNFVDERLDNLLLHYKARNYPGSLAKEEVEVWDKWRAEKIMEQLPAFSKSLQKLSTQSDISNDKMFILQELQLWAESIIPVELGE
jgi:exodeoxyribonuclease-1